MAKEKATNRSFGAAVGRMFVGAIDTSNMPAEIKEVAEDIKEAVAKTAPERVLDDAAVTTEGQEIPGAKAAEAKEGEAKEA